MKQFLYAIGALFLFCTQMHAIASFQLWRGPHGSLVLILGDIHSVDTFHPHCHRFADIVKESLLKEPLPLILELNEKSLEAGATFFRSLLAFMHLFKEKASLEKGQTATELLENAVSSATIVAALDDLKEHNSNIEIAPFDPRGYYSSTIACLVRHLYSTIIVPFILGDPPLKSGTLAYVITTLNELKKERLYPEVGEILSQQEWEALREKIVHHKVEFEVEKQRTVGGLLEELKAQCKELQVLKATYQNNEPIYELIAQEIEYFEEAVNEITSDFKESDLDQPFQDVIIAKFLASETPLDLLRFYERYERLYCQETDARFYELYLLDSILLKAKKEVPLCFHIGHAHAEKLHDLLTAVPGWELVTARTLWKGYSCFQNLAAECPDFEGQLEYATRTLLKPLMVEEKCVVTTK